MITRVLEREPDRRADQFVVGDAGVVVRQVDRRRAEQRPAVQRHPADERQRHDEEQADHDRRGRREGRTGQRTPASGRRAPRHVHLARHRRPPVRRCRRRRHAQPCCSDLVMAVLPSASDLAASPNNAPRTVLQPRALRVVEGGVEVARVRRLALGHQAVDQHEPRIGRGVLVRRRGRCGSARPCSSRSPRPAPRRTSSRRGSPTPARSSCWWRRSRSRHRRRRWTRRRPGR